MLITPLVCLSISIGLFLNKPWADLVGQYAYPPLSILILSFAAWMLASLSLPRDSWTFILLFTFFFNGLALFYLLPALFYFHAPLIRRIHLWLKILLSIIYFAPIITFFLIFSVIPSINKARQDATRYPVHLNGTVINVETKQPVADAVVGIFYQLKNFETTTDAHGAFSINFDFKAERPATYGLYVKKEGYIHNTLNEPYTDEEQTRVLEVFKQEQNIILPQGSHAVFSRHFITGNEGPLYFSMKENAFIANPGEADLIVTSQEIQVPPGGGIKLAAPEKNFEEISTCGNEGYTNAVVKPIHDNFGISFCLKTPRGHYAKLEVQYGQILLWVLQPDGTDHLKTKITYQYPLKYYCTEHPCDSLN